MLNGKARHLMGLALMQLHNASLPVGLTPADVCDPAAQQLELAYYRPDMGSSFAVIIIIIISYCAMLGFRDCFRYLNEGECISPGMT